MHLEFMSWFEKDSPNFMNSYGRITKFYDRESDSFQIDEIQTAYEEFKKGETPSSLYFSWRHSH